MDNTFTKYIGYLILAFWVLCAFYSCNLANTNNEETEEISQEALQAQNVDAAIDLSEVPNDTITATDPDFSIKNGLFYYKDKKYSGILTKYHPRVRMLAHTFVFEGKHHGAYNSYYENGALFETKQYKHNRVTGRHYIYWKNGKLKADNWYYDGKMEGTQKKWYQDGSPFYVFNYKNGKRDGKQKACRISGKLQINSEIINGRTYGLNRAALCYNLKEEKKQISGYAKVRGKKAFYLQ